MDDTPVEATQKYIDGIVWPASKDEVIRVVAHNGAPDDIVQALRAADKPRFVSPSDIANVLWKEA